MSTATMYAISKVSYTAAMHEFYSLHPRLPDFLVSYTADLLRKISIEFWTHTHCDTHSHTRLIYC